jgi:hypothetical protein
MSAETLLNGIRNGRTPRADTSFVVPFAVPQFALRHVHVRLPCDGVDEPPAGEALGSRSSGTNAGGTLAGRHRRKNTAMISSRSFVVASGALCPKRSSARKLSHDVLTGSIEVRLRSHTDGCDTRHPVGFVERWFVGENLRQRGAGCHWQRRSRRDLTAAWRWPPILGLTAPLSAGA